MRLHELQERRAVVVTEMRGIADKAEAESRDYTDAEDTKHKELRTELGALDKKIERARDVAEAERAAPAILHHGHGDGRFEERARGFSLVKAINARLGDPVDAGFEREISAEVARRSGRKFEGIPVPDEYFLVERRTFGDQVMTVGGNGASLYPTVHRGDLFIDMLRASLVTGRLGATILDGLVGTQEIPKQTQSATGQWLGEDSSLTDTAQDFDDVTLAPKTVGAISSYSRRLFINAVPSIENIVRADLSNVIANAIDNKAMLGDGSSNTPTGVVHQSGVPTISMSGGATWEKILDFGANIQHANADIGSLGWALSAFAAKRLRATTKVTDDGSAGFIMETPTALAGYPAAITSALPGSIPDPDYPVDATVIFGAWSQLLIGYWSGTDILVNPFETTAYQKGRVLVRAMRDCNVAVRHAESFAFSTDMPVVPAES
jgi:HK97 family phage major capsid protein